MATGLIVAGLVTGGLSLSGLTPLLGGAVQSGALAAVLVAALIFGTILGCFLLILGLFLSIGRLRFLASAPDGIHFDEAQLFGITLVRRAFKVTARLRIETQQVVHSEIPASIAWLQSDEPGPLTRAVAEAKRVAHILTPPEHRRWLHTASDALSSRREAVGLLCTVMLVEAHRGRLALSRVRESRVTCGLVRTRKERIRLSAGPSHVNSEDGTLEARIARAVAAPSPFEPALGYLGWPAFDVTRSLFPVPVFNPHGRLLSQVKDAAVQSGVGRWETGQAQQPLGWLERMAAWTDNRRKRYVVQPEKEDAVQAVRRSLQAFGEEIQRREPALVEELEAEVARGLAHIERSD